MPRHSFITTLILLLIGCSSSEEPESSLEPLAQSAVEASVDAPEATLGAVDVEPALVPEIEPDPLGEEEPLPHEIAEYSEIPEPEPTSSYTLRRGETLAHFSRWSGLPVEEIAEASGLDLAGQYPVGTEILVPGGSDAQSVITEKRDSHHTRRVEGYLSSRGGSLRTEFHTVKTGETAWSIAKDTHGIPVWVLESYNPTANLDALRPGQDLMVPVLADIVVDAGDTGE